jgi:hypothetical protein
MGPLEIVEVGKILLDLLVLGIALVSTFLGWKDYRKDIKKAKQEDEIRQTFVRFLLSIVSKYKKTNSVCSKKTMVVYKHTDYI